MLMARQTFVSGSPEVGGPCRNKELLNGTEHPHEPGGVSAAGRRKAPNEWYVRVD